MSALLERSWRGAKVTVAGLGTFGGQVAAAKYFAGLGAAVTVTDRKGAEALEASVRELDGCAVRFVLGGHRMGDFTGADLIVASPAIPEDNEFLAAAESAGVQITHEMDMFFLLCPAGIIGVTGSNGKSTAAALLAHILGRHREAGAGPPARRVHLGGNIGRSLLMEVEEISPRDIVVLELSSFQLEDLGAMEVSPHGALVTNLSPNHLDRHGTFENYARAKRNITRWQSEGDFLILNADDPNLSGWRDTAARVAFFGANAGCGEKGVFVSGGSLVSTMGGRGEAAAIPDGWGLMGAHNLLNLAAACAAAGELGVGLAEAVPAAADFKALPHRLERLGEVSGVTFYNDSIATTPESAVAALASFSQPVVLIAGGYDKGLDLGPFARAAARSVKALVVIGATAGAIAEEAVRERADLPVQVLGGLPEAVAAAFRAAAPGDVVVLSPACASYDMFGNFQERGECFRREVEGLADRCTQGRS